MRKKVAIIGAGPAGCMCACNLNSDADITLFDPHPLKTILPTGGGRCNLAYAEYDFKELAKNYPRGEKFLYSVFSRFSTLDTIDFFNKIGVKTYTQDDLRIFPISNSSKEVKEKLLAQLKHCKFKTETVSDITNDLNVNGEKFDFVVIATGGHDNFKLIENLKHTIIDPKPSLTGLITTEDFSKLAGVSVVASCKTPHQNLIDTLLFTHKGISGPLVFKISSLFARNKFPYEINLNFMFENHNLQEIFNINPHKNLSTIINELIPASLAQYIFRNSGIEFNKKCHQVTAKTRELITQRLSNYKITIISPQKHGEIVTCGGVSLDEVNPKTLESKIIPNLYFCGEVLNADGFCGGFNLQTCWSTGYLSAKSINTI